MSRNFDCLSLRTLFDRYYRPRKLLGRSEKNAYQYFMQLRHLARFLGREPTTDDLDDDTLAALERIREPARDLIFPWRLHRSTFYHHYRRLIERAGLSYTRSGPQKMRRSFASHLEAAGGNATAALQHCNRSVTLKSYIDPRIVRPEAAWRKLPKIQ